MHARLLPAALAAALLLVAGHARAEGVGEPYRGPVESLGGGGQDQPPGDPGNPQRTPTVDGQILWQFWWEHNKDRYLARATKRGRVRAGSVDYWFGAVAKYPAREIKQVSAGQHKRAFRALRKLLRADPDARVRTAAAIAIGRLGTVAAKKGGGNLVVKELQRALGQEKAGDVRKSAILALGMSGDATGCAYLLEHHDGFSAAERAYANLAFGLARYGEAVPLLKAQLPRNARRGATDPAIAAVCALGLIGPDAREGLGPDGLKQLRRLAHPGGADALALQAVRTLSLLGEPSDAAARLLESSRNQQWAALLALSYQTGDATKATRLLQGRRGFRSGDGQSKCFAVLAMGELAGRLDPNDKVRGKLLAFLREDALESPNSYVRACAAVALGVADDRAAVAAVTRLVSHKASPNHVVAAACVGLGLLRATKQAEVIKRRVMLDRRWNADTRGYAALGIALMGDTTSMDDLRAFARSGGLTTKTRRQMPLALGVLGDKRDVRWLINSFRNGWQQSERHEASNAAFGLAWLRDASAVKRLAALASKSPDARVRGMAATALGYLGARDRVSPIARCYANTNHRNRFGNWELLREISLIL